MASLRIVSETGFFHIACRMEYDDGRVRWVGWQPVKGGAYWSRDDVGRGFIETEDKEAAGKVNNYVTFRVSEAELDRADHDMVKYYVAGDDTYGFGLRDCVTFARDVASYCGLKVHDVMGHPIARIDFLPYELLLKLYWLNEDRVIAAETSLGIELPAAEEEEESPRPGELPLEAFHRFGQDPPAEDLRVDLPSRDPPVE